jgi:DNA-binding CsgD family transcriptional regulator
MWGVGDSNGAFAVYAAAAEILPDEPSPERAAVLAEEARAYMLMSRNREGRLKAEQAIAAASEAGAVAVGGHARNTLGCCLAALGEPDRAIALLREAVEIAEETLSPEDLNRGYGNLSFVLMNSGRIEEGANVVFDALAMGEEIGGMRLNSAASNSIDALMHLGRWDEAEELQEMVGVAPYGSCVASTFVDRLPFAIRRARYTDVDGWLASAHELTDGLYDVQFSANLHTLEAEYQLDRNDPARAVELMHRAAELCLRGEDPVRIPETMQIGLRAAADLAHDPRSDTAQRDSVREVAKTWLAAAEKGIEEWLATGADLPALHEGYLLLCRAEYTRMDRSDPQAWVRAAERFDATPSVYLAAYCRMREAEALLGSRGSRSRAAERLLEAWSVSRRLNAKPLTARIEALAQRSKLELEEPNAAADADDTAERQLGLTARENEILRYLAVGDSDRDIAERLYISKKTVSVHVSNILRKLQVSSRVEAGKIAQTHGVRP